MDATATVKHTYRASMFGGSAQIEYANVTLLKLDAVLPHWATIRVHG
jgi:hypothetical protein